MPGGHEVPPEPCLCNHRDGPQSSERLVANDAQHRQRVPRGAPSLLMAPRKSPSHSQTRSYTKPRRLISPRSICSMSRSVTASGRTICEQYDVSAARARRGHRPFRRRALATGHHFKPPGLVEQLIGLAGGQSMARLGCYLIKQRVHLAPREIRMGWQGSLLALMETIAASRRCTWRRWSPSR
jgi:hypothetical protein